ncbi:hypothetical protein D3C74_433690 [compost metagenome]
MIHAPVFSTSALVPAPTALIAERTAPPTVPMRPVNVEAAAVVLMKPARKLENAEPTAIAPLNATVAPRATAILAEYTLNAPLIASTEPAKPATPSAKF